MKKYRLLYILLLITVVFLSVFYFLHTLSPNKEFTKFTDSLFQSEVASNTLTLHYTVAHPKNFGIHDYEVTLGSYSPENEQETCAAIENYSNSLSQMNRDALNTENKLTYDILNYYIQHLHMRVILVICIRPFTLIKRTTILSATYFILVDIQKDGPYM